VLLSTHEVIAPFYSGNLFSNQKCYKFELIDADVNININTFPSFWNLLKLMFFDTNSFNCVCIIFIY